MEEFEDQNQLPEEPPDQEVETLPVSSRKWMTPLIGLVMLLIGVGLGYVGRGVIGPEATASRGTATAAAAAIQTRSASNQEVMAAIIAETRHFKGDENAPVVMIEFSDYQ